MRRLKARDRMAVASRAVAGIQAGDGVKMLSRRQLLGGLLVSGVAGCASDPNSTVNLFSKTITAKGRSADEYPLSAAQIHDIPYATLGVRIASNPRAVIVLATAEGRTLQWVSADHVTFVTRGGWLLRTHGLQRDLAATRWQPTSEEDPLLVYAQTGVLPQRGVYREIDLGHADEHGIDVESHFEVGKDETIVIQGRERLTRRMDEIAVMRAWRWETRNSFWFDPQSGQVWRSVQQYCPEMPQIEFEVLKSAGV